MQIKKTMLIVLIIIVIIGAIVIISKEIRTNNEKIIQQEKKEISEALRDIMTDKILHFTKGYNIDEIQNKMYESVGYNKVIVYRNEETDKVIIKYLKTKHEYKVDDLANKRWEF